MLRYICQSKHFPLDVFFFTAGEDMALRALAGLSEHNFTVGINPHLPIQSAIAMMTKAALCAFWHAKIMKRLQKLALTAVRLIDRVGGTGATGRGDLTCPQLFITQNQEDRKCNYKRPQPGSRPMHATQGRTHLSQTLCMRHLMSELHCSGRVYASDSLICS